MDRRPLGRTGLRISALALGTVALGMDYGLRVPGAHGRPAAADAVSGSSRACGSLAPSYSSISPGASHSAPICDAVGSLLAATADRQSRQAVTIQADRCRSRARRG